MSDQNLLDDPLVSFDQSPSSTKTKPNESYENRLLDDIDPFGDHNGTNGNNNNNDSSTNQFSLTNDLFPTDPNENGNCSIETKWLFLLFDYLDLLSEFSTQKNQESENLILNGSVADKNTLLLEFDSDAPAPVNNTESPNDPFKQFENLSIKPTDQPEILLDFGNSNENANKEEEEVQQQQQQQHEPEVLQSNEQIVDTSTHSAPATSSSIESESKSEEIPVAAITPSESIIKEEPTPSSPQLDSTLPLASPTKKPTASATKPTSSAKPKSATPTSKSTESKPAVSTTRKTVIPSSSNKTAPVQDTSATAKPTVIHRTEISKSFSSIISLF